MQVVIHINMPAIGLCTIVAGVAGLYTVASVTTATKIVTSIVDRHNGEYGGIPE